MVEAVEPSYKEYAIEEFLVRDEPYYVPVADELEIFTAAYRQHIPVLLKGPTGCGKTLLAQTLARILALLMKREAKAATA